MSVDNEPLMSDPDDTAATANATYMVLGGGSRGYVDNFSVTAIEGVNTVVLVR